MSAFNPSEAQIHARPHAFGRSLTNGQMTATSASAKQQRLQRLTCNETLSSDFLAYKPPPAMATPPLPPRVIRVVRYPHGNAMRNITDEHGYSEPASRPQQHHVVVPKEELVDEEDEILSPPPPLALEMLLPAGADQSAEPEQSVEQPGSDASTATPSHDGDAQELDDDMSEKSPEREADSQEPPAVAPCQQQPIDVQVSEMRQSLTFLSHQMQQIMKALHVSPCPCEACRARIARANVKAHVAAAGGLPASLTPQMLQQMFPQGVPPQIAAQIKGALQQQQAGQNYAQQCGGGKMGSGASSGASAVDRRTVAEYARQFGAIAAARRFGVAPPVASYYQRKDSTNGVSPGPSTDGDEKPSVEGIENTQPAPPPPQLAPAVGTAAAAAPPMSQLAAQLAAGAPPTLANSAAGIPPAMVDFLKMNAAHSSGSPGFLRGRGRGRPKLIGDELDADLVDYMVQVKQADPHGHLTASQALQIAREYIMEKAPGLLEEHGGHVKLKLTWAMKLVSRIAERQREQELGLPAGTLSNMGRQMQQAASGASLSGMGAMPGGNFMADVMAQNLLSQQMTQFMSQMQAAQCKDGSVAAGSVAGGEDATTEGADATAPEITNVKELNLDFLSAAPEITNVKELNLDFGALNGEGVMESGEIINPQAV